MMVIKSWLVFKISKNIVIGLCQKYHFPWRILKNKKKDVEKNLCSISWRILKNGKKDVEQNLCQSLKIINYIDK